MQSQQKDLERWIRSKENLFEANKLSERQIKKDREYSDKRFEEMSRKASSINEAEARLMR